MMSITGPMTLAAKGLQATLVAKDQDTAFYLAQDGVEFVRWVRDTNKLKGNAWLAGLDGTSNGFTQADGSNGDCVSTTGLQNCTVNSLNPSSQNDIASCGASGAACSAINYDSANNFFTYANTGTASIFTRTISIKTPVGTNDCTAGHGCEATLTVIVTWHDQGNLVRNVTVREELFSWQ